MGFVPAKSLYVKAGLNQTVADPDFRMGGGGGGYRLGDKGGAPSPKISFQLFGPHFGLKIRGVPRFLPWVHRCQIFKVIYDCFHAHTI